eukprot:TRINITY_DN16848_c0_g1_i1.p1 TRINITY_DN16848_c0_g1~~TRINITY_DN16848_c0_g1_i1.p1  ORF type:complete len:276 (-),score=20.15 TRINITY_DN16848_c0_g1_i1:138-926(-)
MDEVRDLTDRPLRVFVFIGVGADPSILATQSFRKLRTWRNTVLTAGSQIPTPFTTKEYDVVVFPGGTASVQRKTLGDTGAKAVTEFVQAGGGFVGICGGAYLGGTNPKKPWTLALLQADFWLQTKGNLSGTVKLQPYNARDDVTQALLGGSTAAFTCHFHNGACFYTDRCGTDVTPVVTIQNIPQGFPKPMRGMAAVVTGMCGNGRVVLCGPHPEQTPALESFVHNMIKWASNSPLGFGLVNQPALVPTVCPEAEDPEDPEA